MLPNFPAEVWHEILSLLAPQDLKKLRLVDKSCRDLASPLLFREVHLNINVYAVKRLSESSNSQLKEHFKRMVAPFRDLEESNSIFSCRHAGPCSRRYQVRSEEQLNQIVNERTSWMQRNGSAPEEEVEVNTEFKAD